MCDLFGNYEMRMPSTSIYNPLMLLKNRKIKIFQYNFQTNNINHNLFLITIIIFNKKCYRRSM